MRRPIFRVYSGGSAPGGHRDLGTTADPSRASSRLTLRAVESSEVTRTPCSWPTISPTRRCPTGSSMPSTLARHVGARRKKRQPPSRAVGVEAPPRYPSLDWDARRARAPLGEGRPPPPRREDGALLVGRLGVGDCREGVPRQAQAAVRRRGVRRHPRCGHRRHGPADHPVSRHRVGDSALASPRLRSTGCSSPRRASNASS